MKVLQIFELPRSIYSLGKEARREGFKHIDRLIDDFADHSNKFQLEGEALFGGYESHSIIAIGGVNQQPSKPSERTGRIRRVYVHPRYRRGGAGSDLMTVIEDHAKKHFARLQLFTESEVASSFYASLGYKKASSTENVSHEKFFNGK